MQISPGTPVSVTRQLFKKWKVMSFEYLRPLFLISLIINLHSLICNNGSVYQWVHQVPKNLTTGFHESGQAGSSTPRAKAENVPGGGRTHSRSGTQRRRHKSWGFDLWVWKIPRLLEMAGNGNPLALRVPWTEEPGGLHSTGLQKVRHDWATKRTPFWSMWIPRTVLTCEDLDSDKFQLFPEKNIHLVMGA